MYGFVDVFVFENVREIILHVNQNLYR